jgi:PhzF family phenazine biosynthesis protein
MTHAPTRLRYRIVDAFTDTAFSGNPAAVVLPGSPESGVHQLDDGMLQRIAREMNLSETAFPHLADASGVRRLRWFTPTTEVSLCGHATLAAAHALLEATQPTSVDSDANGASPLRFSSRSGPLEVGREPDGRLRLNFPLDAPEEGPIPDGIAAALGLSPDEPIRWAHGARCALVEVTSEARLRSLAPDARALGAIPLPKGVMGISVTARGEEADFVSRFFGPWVGVDEDPVTGMAHCLLAPWWAAALGRTTLRAAQWAGVGPGARGGELEVRIVDASESDAAARETSQPAGSPEATSHHGITPRVHLVGRAVTVAEGELRLRS